MAHHLDTGKTGENLAGQYLLENHFLVVETNWRFSHYEIDIIASKGKILHFVEVKTRRSKGFGPPELKVDVSKLAKLKAAASEYLFQNPHWHHIQFDIIAIVLTPDKTPEIFLLEDVF